MTPAEIRAFVDRHYGDLHDAAIDKASSSFSLTWWAHYFSHTLNVSLTREDTLEVLREYNRRREQRQ